MLLPKRAKIFCIGSNKTGTTSLGAALQSLGFRLGDQATAELLMEDWAKRDFRRLVQFCQGADAFQDLPFSLDHTYGVLDYVFPGSKFILTVRSSADEWYQSLLRFHTQLIGKGRLPTVDDLKAHPYRGPGWLWRAHVLIHSIDQSLLYDRDHYIRQYETHLQNVAAYFEHRPADLLVLNLSAVDAMDSLCRFLKVDGHGLSMPHLNRSRDDQQQASGVIHHACRAIRQPARSSAA